MWRLTIKWPYGSRTVDVADVQQLRQTIMRLRGDPNVTGYTYLRQPDHQPRKQCPRCDRAYYPGDVDIRECRCGVQHTTYYCPQCQTSSTEPPREEGCASLPFDAERWSSRDWAARRRAR